jgi:hypothetical protein
MCVEYYKELTDKFPVRAWNFTNHKFEWSYSERDRRNSLTHSLAHGAEVSSCGATKEFTNILWKLKVHYCLHKSTPPGTILSQTNPIYIILPYLRSILTLFTHLRHGLLVVSFLLAFTPISYMQSSAHSCYMPRPSHPSWRDYFNYTWRRVQVMKLLIIFIQRVWQLTIYHSREKWSVVMINDQDFCSLIDTHVLEVGPLRREEGSVFLCRR